MSESDIRSYFSSMDAISTQSIDSGVQLEYTSRKCLQCNGAGRKLSSSSVTSGSGGVSVGDDEHEDLKIPVCRIEDVDGKQDNCDWCQDTNAPSSPVMMGPPSLTPSLLYAPHSSPRSCTSISELEEDEEGTEEEKPEAEEAAEKDDHHSRTSSNSSWCGGPRQDKQEETYSRTEEGASPMATREQSLPCLAHPKGGCSCPVLVVDVPVKVSSGAYSDGDSSGSGSQDIKKMSRGARLKKFLTRPRLRRSQSVVEAPDASHFAKMESSERKQKKLQRRSTSLSVDPIETTSVKTKRIRDLARSVGRVLTRRNTESSVGQKAMGRDVSEQARLWALSIDNLLADKEGLARFRLHMKSEIAEENLDFYVAVEEYKAKEEEDERAQVVEDMCQRFVQYDAEMEINLRDSALKNDILSSAPSGDDLPALLEKAQRKIRLLLEASYPRFLESKFFTELLPPNNANL